jgi:hypothetical protein
MFPELSTLMALMALMPVLGTWAGVAEGPAAAPQTAIGKTCGDPRS